MALTNRVRIVLAESGFKHGDMSAIAKKIGVTRTTMSAIINKEGYKPELETAIRFARVVGKPVEEIWLLNDKDS